MHNRLVILGAGGHGKVVADAVIKQNSYHLVGFVDDTKAIGEAVFLNHCNIAHFNTIDSIANLADYFIVALGNNVDRDMFFQRLITVLKPALIVHPAASIALNSHIEDGCVILAGAIINSNARIGRNTIINTGAIIDHDSIIAENSHIAQGAMVAGKVHLPPFFTASIAEVIHNYPKLS